jgi:hypothetical protein
MNKNKYRKVGSESTGFFPTNGCITKLVDKYLSFFFSYDSRKKENVEDGTNKKWIKEEKT